MRRVISLVIGFCFLVNNVSFALSPPMVSGGLREHTVHDKNIVLAEAGLAYELGELNKLEEIVGETDKEKIKKIFEKKKLFQAREIQEKDARQEKTVFDPAEVTPYINMLDHVGGNIFNVPVSVDKGGAREDYQLLFSTIKDGDHGFPIFFLTDEQFKKVKDSVSIHNTLPYMEENEAKFVDNVRTRYSAQNEDIIDKVISGLITGEIPGGKFYEIEGRREKLGWDKKFSDAKRPDKKKTAFRIDENSLHVDTHFFPSIEKLFEYLEHSLNPFFSRIDKNFNLKHAINKKNLVFLKFPESMDYPVIKENGEDVKVFSHTSNNVVYLFYKQNTCVEDLLKNLIHEIGVIYGVYWHLGRNGNNKFMSFRNKFDYAYDIHRDDAESDIEDLLAELRQYVSRGPVNLDELFWKDPVTGDYVVREHAMGKRVPFETDPVKKRHQMNKKQLAMSIAYAIYAENRDKFEVSETDFDSFLTNSANGIDLTYINIRFRIYFDAAIAYYMAGEEPFRINEKSFKEIVTLDPKVQEKFRKSTTSAVLLDLVNVPFPEKIDEVLRQKAISWVQKITRVASHNKYAISEVFELKANLEKYRNPFAVISNKLTEIHEIFYIMIGQFYGSASFNVQSEEFLNILKTSMREIHERETNPYWRTVEEDLAASRDADNTVVIEPDWDGVISVVDPWPVLKRFSDKTGETDNKFELKNAEGKDLLHFVSKAYSKLNLCVNREDSSLSEWYAILPKSLQTWMQSQYTLTCGEDAREILHDDKNRDVILSLRKIVSDWLQKARDGKIFIEKGRFFASPRTMKISHVRRGLLREDTGFHVGEYFLREFLGREVSEDRIVEELMIFMLNEAMHIGNSIIKHGKIKVGEDDNKFNEKIEHIKIPAVEEVRKRWVNCVGKKPWEPMADAYPERRQGIFVGKNPEIIAGLERAKQFVANDDERVLLVRGAKGDGKSHLAETVRGLMGILSEKDPKYYRADCDELTAFGDKQHIHDLFFGKEKEDGTLKSSILAQFASSNQKSLLVFDHIEKADDYVFSILRQLLNDHEEIRLSNGEVISLANLKILILADEKEMSSKNADKNLKSLRTDLKNQTVRIPRLQLRGYKTENGIEHDVVSLAEEFNFDYSVKKDIPWARIEKDMGDILIKWVEASDPGVDDNVRDLKKIIERLTQTRKVLQARMKKDGHIGTTDIFGEKINLPESFQTDENSFETIELWHMFSPYLITVVDFLYSGLGVPDSEMVTKEIKPAITTLHYKFQNRVEDTTIYPYFKELAPNGFYYGKRREQPGMTENDENFFKQYSDCMFIFSPNAVFNDGLRESLPAMIKDGLNVAVLAQNEAEIRELARINDDHFGKKYKGIIILKKPKDVKDVPGKIQKFYYFNVIEDKPDDDFNQLLDDFEKIDITDLVTGIKNKTFKGDVTLAVLSNVEKPALVEPDVKEFEQDAQEQDLKWLSRMIPEELYAKAMASNPEYITAILERFKIYVDVAIAQLVSGEDPELKADFDINADFLGGIYDNLDIIKKNAIPQKLDHALCNGACNLVDLYRKTVLSRLEEMRGMAFDAFLSEIKEGVEVKATRNGIIADAFAFEESEYFAVYKQTNLAKLLSDIVSSLVEENGNSYWRTVEEDVKAFRLKKDKVIELERDKDDDPSTMLRGAHKLLKSWVEIHNIEKLPEPLKNWIGEKAKEIKKNTPSKNIDEIQTDLFWKIRKYIENALDTKIFMIKDEFYVSPRTKEMMHVRRGIKQDDTGIYLGELFIKAYSNLAMKNKLVQETGEFDLHGEAVCEDFALLLLNEAMHVGKPSARHKKITSLEDFGNVTEHIKLTYFDKVRREWEYGNFKKPWKTQGAVLPNENIGKSKSIRNIFEELHTFVRFKTQNTLLLEGPSGSGKTKTTEAIEALMALKKDAVRTIDCAALAGVGTAKLLKALYGTYPEEKYHAGGLIRTLAYKKGIVDGDNKRESALLIIKNLQDADITMQAQLKAILHDSKKNSMISGEILDMGNIKIVCQTEKPVDSLSGTLKTLLKENSQYNIRLPELYERRRDITFFAEFFNFVESKENDLSWAPLDQYAAGAIRILFGKKHKKTNIKPKTVLDLKNFMAKIVKERALLLERVNADGYLGDKDLLGKKVRDKIDDEEVLLFLENMFSKCLITCADIAYSSAEIKEHEMFELVKFVKLVRKKAGKEQSLFPHFREEFAPRDPDGKIIGFYKGPSPWNQPGMMLSPERDAQKREEQTLHTQNLKKLANGIATAIFEMNEEGDVPVADRINLVQMYKDSSTAEREEERKFSLILHRIAARYYVYVFEMIGYFIATQGEVWPDESILKIDSSMEQNFLGAKCSVSENNNFLLEIDPAIRQAAIDDAKQLLKCEKAFNIVKTYYPEKKLTSNKKFNIQKMIMEEKWVEKINNVVVTLQEEIYGEGDPSSVPFYRETFLDFLLNDLKSSKEKSDQVLVNTTQEENSRRLAKIVADVFESNVIFSIEKIAGILSDESISKFDYLTAILEQFRIYVDLAIADFVTSEDHSFSSHIFSIKNGYIDKAYDDMDFVRLVTVSDKLEDKLFKEACRIVELYRPTVLNRLDHLKHESFDDFFMAKTSDLPRDTRDDILRDAFGFSGKGVIKYQNTDFARILSKITSSRAEEKKNSFWRTVEEDVNAFREMDGKITELERAEDGTDTIAESTDKDFLEILDKSYELLESWEKIDIVSDLPEPLKNWVVQKYDDITGGNSINGDEIMRRIMDHVKWYIKNALNAKIFMINGEFYVSPRTQEVAHVRRRIKQDDTGTYLGEFFIKSYYELGWDDNGTLVNSEVVEDFTIFLLNESMHIGKPSAEHKKITSLEDFAKVTDHIELTYFDKICREWGHKNYKKPWKTRGAEFPGGNIGNSGAITKVFEDLRVFTHSKTENTLLLEGKHGSGKTKTTEAIQALMGIKDEAVRTIDCSLLADLKTSELRREFYGEYPGGKYVDKSGIVRALAYEDGRIAEVNKRPSALLVIKNLQDADSRMIAQLKAILHDSKKIPMTDGEVLDLSNVKIVCQLDSPIGHLKESFGRVLKNSVQFHVQLPDLYDRYKDTAFLAELFNYIESKANSLTLAPLEQHAAELIWHMFGEKPTGSKIKTKTILDLKNFMAKVVRDRARLMERLKTQGDLGDETLRGTKIQKKININDKEVVAFKCMFSKCLITITDIVYSSVDISHDEANILKKIALNEKTVKETSLLPYFIEEFAPRNTEGEIVGFYKGPYPWEQIGMADTRSEAGESTRFSTAMKVNRKNFTRQLAEQFFKMKFWHIDDLKKEIPRESVEEFIRDLTSGQGEDEPFERKIMSEASLRFKTYVDQALASLYGFVKSEEKYHKGNSKSTMLYADKKDFRYHAHLKHVLDRWKQEYCTNTFPEEIDMLLRDKAVRLVLKVDKDSKITDELSKLDLGANDLTDAYAKLFPMGFRMVTYPYTAAELRPIRDSIVAQSFGEKDPMNSSNFLGWIGKHITSIYEKEVNPYWKEIETNLGNFVEADRAFEVITTEIDEIKSVKTGRNMDWPFEKLGHDKFLDTVNEAYKLLDLWAKDFSEKSGDRILNFNKFSIEVQKWIAEKYCDITGKTEIDPDTFWQDEETRPVLLEYLRDCADKARKSILTIVEGTFYVSPTTNTIIHDGRGISQDTPRVWMGEHYLLELGLGTDNGMTVVEFAVVLLNAGMHMENVSVRHGKIESIEDIGRVIDHISLSDKYGKAERAWWKYMKNPYPWQETKDKDTFLSRSPFGKGGWGDFNDFINSANTRSLLIQGKPGLIKLAEDVRADMQKAKNMSSEQIKTISCKELLQSASSPDGLRAEFFGGYDKDGKWRPGVLEQIGYRERSNEAYVLNLHSLLVIDDLHVLVEALKDEKSAVKALELLTIFKEVLDKKKKIHMPGNIVWIDIKNLKILFVSNKELTGEISGVLNVDKKVTVPELWTWEDNDIAGMAEEFSREESEKAGISWAPLEENTAQFIIDHVKENKFQIKDLQEFMNAIVAERAKWMNEWEKTGTIPEVREYDDVSLDMSSFSKYFSPYFTSLFFIPSEMIKEGKDFNSLGWTFVKMINSWRTNHAFKPYFKEFRPLDSRGEPRDYYGGPFLSKDGTIYEQPGMHPPMHKRGTPDKKNPAVKTKAIIDAMDVMDALPDHYREKNGTNHKDVANAMHEVTYLKDSDADSVMDYLEKFFSKYLFRGDNCRVNVERIDNVPDEIKFVPRSQKPNLMKQAFKKPPRDFDKAMFIDIFELTKDKQGRLHDRMVEPAKGTRYRYNVPWPKDGEYEKVPATYHICVSFKKTAGTDNVESIHVEMRSNQNTDSEVEFDITQPMMKKSTPQYAAKTIRDDIWGKGIVELIRLRQQDKLPIWVENAIDKNVINLSRFDRKSALVFSENVTFKNGVGALLPKLVKAGIEVAVVARADDQIDAINALNQTELADDSGKIVILRDPSEARNTIKNTQQFYYFRVKEDIELDHIPDDGNFSVNDITGMVKQIIEALGRASGINIQSEINKLHTAAKKFAQSV